MVKGERLITTPAAAILEGITRDTVLVLARDFGYDVIETPLSRDALYTADEVFVCGTASEVIGLREIDGRRIGAGRTGAITRRFQDAYRAVTTGVHPRSAEWLEPVLDLDAQRSA